MFPEVFLSGYTNFSMSEVYSMAETSNGPAFKFVSTVAQQANISILYGYIEQDPANASLLYDAAQLVDNKGAALLNHRKVQLAGPGEKAIFTPGSRFGPVVDLYGVKVGVLICYEVSFPEPSRVLALQQAELILIPTANGMPPPLNVMSMYQVPSRASENVAHVAYCNFAQPGGLLPFYGFSRIADPSGATLAVGEASDDESAVMLISADITPSNYMPQCVLLGDRVPAKYDVVCDPNGYCLR